jgi:hypothetical protein
MALEFERVTVQYSSLLDVIEKVRFYGINGLIKRENDKISPFYFHLLDDTGERFLIIVFSIPIFQSLDSIALQTAMEYFAALLRRLFCEKSSVFESESLAFNDIKNLPIIRSKGKDLFPYEDFTEKIEMQLRMKVRLGLQIFPINKIKEDISLESMQHISEYRKVKSALITVQSNLREYSAKITNKYRISVKPYLFETAAENRFEPTVIPVFTLNAMSQVKDDFSVLVFSAEVVNRIDPDQLKILIAYEIIFDLLKDKFSRGLLEREIYQILSNGQKDDPGYMISKEMIRLFPQEVITQAQNAIKQTIETLLEANYPIIRLD